jgi:hypothetical protein
MSVASIGAALALVNSNLPPWGSISSAQQFLNGAVYLQINRARHLEETTTNIDFESLESNARAARKFLGATNPRAFGRNRRITAITRVGGIA